MSQTKITIEQARAEIKKNNLRELNEFRSIAASIGNDSNGKVFKSIAEATNIYNNSDPKPADKLRFFVINSNNPDENGEYFWDSALPANYDFLRPIREGNIRKNTFDSYFVHGGLVGETGAEAKADIRVRSGFFATPPGNYTYAVEGNLIFNSIIAYNGENYIDVLEDVNDDSPLTIPEGTTHCRVSLRRTDNAVITEEDIVSTTFKLQKFDAPDYDFQNFENLLKWKNKEMVVVGTSISNGFIPRNDPRYGENDTLNSYARLTARKLGMKFTNAGVNGSTLAAKGIDNPIHSPFVYRYENLPDSASLIVVEGGTNDLKKDIPLGEFSDRIETTFYGALHTLCLGLIEKYQINPGTKIGKDNKIVFLTSPKLGIDLEAEVYNGKTIKDFGNAVKEVCEYYSIPVWDAYKLSGINPHIFRTVQGTDDPANDMYNPYIPDSVHPNQDGHEMMSNRFIGFLNATF